MVGTKGSHFIVIHNKVYNTKRFKLRVEIYFSLYKSRLQKSVGTQTLLFVVFNGKLNRVLTTADRHRQVGHRLTNVMRLITIIISIISSKYLHAYHAYNY